MEAMFNREQQAAVAEAFILAGYSGPLVTAEVTSEDERYFLLDSTDYDALHDVRALSIQLSAVLRRKVGVIERTRLWGEPVPFQ
jgi:hypothetical protein